MRLSFRVGKNGWQFIPDTRQVSLNSTQEHTVFITHLFHYFIHLVKRSVMQLVPRSVAQPAIRQVPIFIFVLFAVVFAWGQTQLRSRASNSASDPGPRTGAAGVGGPIAGTNAAELAGFNEGSELFAEINDVQGTVTGDKGLGQIRAKLGPPATWH